MPLINGNFESLKLPPKHGRVLFDSSRKWRYRCLHGGRNGAKDWSVAAACIEIGIREPKRFLFTREVQKTLEDSSIKLIGDTIKRLGYSEYFNIQTSRIKCKINATEFIFRGLNDNVSADVKSTEGIDIAVIGEAQDLTQKSFLDLDPTIRKPGSEIWIIFNDQFEDDFVYEFCVAKPPENMISELVNYTDLPDEWVSQEIKDQAERMKREDEPLYRHIFLGEPSKTGGRVWPDFDEKVHSIPRECNEQLFDFKYLVQNSQMFMSMDPHTVYYPFCLWVARIKIGDEFWLVVYNEFPTVGFFDGKLYHEVRKTIPCTLTMQDLSSIFKILDCTVGDVQLPAKLSERYVDTRFAKASGAQSWSTNTEGLIAEFSKPANGGISFKQPEERLIDVQREVLRDMIKFNKDIPVCSINQPRLLVYPHCKNTIDSLMRHRFDMDNAKESEKRKDPSDSLRIISAGMSTFKWIDPNERKEVAEFKLNFGGANISHKLA